MLCPTGNGPCVQPLLIKKHQTSSNPLVLRKRHAGFLLLFVVNHVQFVYNAIDSCFDCHQRRFHRSGLARRSKAPPCRERKGGVIIPSTQTCRKPSPTGGRERPLVQSQPQPLRYQPPSALAQAAQSWVAPPELFLPMEAVFLSGERGRKTQN